MTVNSINKIIDYAMSCLCWQGVEGEAGVRPARISCLKLHAKTVAINKFRFCCMILEKKKKRKTCTLTVRRSMVT